MKKQKKSRGFGTRLDGTKNKESALSKEQKRTAESALEHLFTPATKDPAWLELGSRHDRFHLDHLVKLSICLSIYF